jgi:hypothetical protein
MIKNVKAFVEFLKVDNLPKFNEQFDEFIATKAPLKKSEKKEKDEEN